ncbi:MAG: hypothetical protein L3J65_02325 [Robiginitomaculum sp.]|nr:hypothetical protein [Robiginitomaculum sp.]
MVKFSLSLLIATLFMVSSCGKALHSIDDANFDVQNPFGLSWVTTDKYSSEVKKKCNNILSPLDVFLNQAEYDHAFESCIVEQYSTFYFPAEELPPSLRQGEFSVSLLGGNQPIQYNYSFLHDWTVDEYNRKSKLRRSHSARVKAKLIKLYGSPTASGHYDQGSRLGFVVDSTVEQPCDFWLVKNVGIFLCSERVVMIDGTEMSLSFIRLDFEPMGEQLRSMLLVSSGKKAEVYNISSANAGFSQTSKVAMLRKLSELIAIDKFGKCNSNSLEPIEVRWALSKTEEAKFSQIFKTHKGDDLAEYAIEYASNRKGTIQGLNQEVAVLFMFQHAAKQGSAVAMNEIGASLLYCLQNVQQDVATASIWLNRAAISGDTLAMYSLARMHLNSLTDATDPRSEAFKLLKKCAVLDDELCAEGLHALTVFINPQPD